jgi:hypothetical protein
MAGFFSTIWTDFWKIFGLNPPASMSTPTQMTAPTAANTAIPATTGTATVGNAPALTGTPTLPQVAAQLNTTIAQGSIVPGGTSVQYPLVQQFQTMYNAQLSSGQTAVPTTGYLDASTQAALNAYNQSLTLNTSSGASPQTTS